MTKPGGAIFDVGGLPAFIAELRCQLRTSLPATLSFLLYKLPWLISLAFVGRIGAQELAAAALATTLCNVTGMSLSVGLSSAIATLAGQARGQTTTTRDDEERREDSGGCNETTPLTTNGNGMNGAHIKCDGSSPNLPLLYLYRGLFVQLLFVLPVGCYWLSGIKPLLIFLGQGEVLSEMTQQYLRILTPGLWGYSINFTLTTWLQTVELAYIPAYAALLGVAMHVPMNLLFIHTMGLGWLGVGLATTVFQIVQPIAMFLYLKGTKRGRSLLMMHTGSFYESTATFLRTATAAIASIHGIWQYLTLALPGMGAPALGKKLGAGDYEGARLSAKVCVAIGGLLSAVLGCILYFTPHESFPSLFTSDGDLIDMASRVLPLLSLYVLADGLQATLNAIIKGCGRQCVLVPIVLGAYWCVALPLSWHLAFVRWGGTTDCNEGTFCGVVGLVGGMTIGTWVHFILLAMYCARIDWSMEAELARERLNFEKQKRYEMEST